VRSSADPGYRFGSAETPPFAISPSLPAIFSGLIRRGTVLSDLAFFGDIQRQGQMEFPLQTSGFPPPREVIADLSTVRRNRAKTGYKAASAGKTQACNVKNARLHNADLVKAALRLFVADVSARPSAS
jgi:hypothetical protein